MESDELKSIRRLWRLHETAGTDAAVEALLELAAPDAEFVPPTADGRVIRCHEEFREHYRGLSASGARVETRAHRFEETEDAIVVVGGIRLYHEGGFSERTVRLEYRFRDGRIVRAGVR